MYVESTDVFHTSRQYVALVGAQLSGEGIIYMRPD